jgi:phosphatidylserine/phosphatidylglycerophosphate/cardiolipin synthase-like enzyme
MFFAKTEMVSVRTSPHPSIKAYFSPKIEPMTRFPELEIAKAIVRELDQARESVLVQAYFLTSNQIIDAIMNAHMRRGVEVQVILDYRKSQEILKDYEKSQKDYEKSQETNKKPKEPGILRLQKSEVPIRLDAIHEIAHNKVMVIDNCTVITGSFNFTETAEIHNAENLLIIKDPALARQYAANWKYHWDHSDELAKNN